MNIASFDRREEAQNQDCPGANSSAQPTMSRTLGNGVSRTMNEVASGNAKDFQIYRLRGVNVILDVGLASYYGVPTRVLAGAVRRVAARFPEEFLFRLEPGEVEELKREHGSQEPWIAQLRRRPYAFTEQGIHAISYFLHSPRAIHMSVELIRSFHSLRHLADEQKGLFDLINEVKKRQDVESKRLWAAIRSVRELEGFREEVTTRLRQPRSAWGPDVPHEKIDAVRYELEQIEQRALRHRDLFYMILMVFGALLTALILFPR